MPSTRAVHKTPKQPKERTFRRHTSSELRFVGAGLGGVRDDAGLAWRVLLTVRWRAGTGKRKDPPENVIRRCETNARNGFDAFNRHDLTDFGWSKGVVEMLHGRRMRFGADRREPTAEVKAMAFCWT
jgi:hypothetical protein